MRRVRCTSWFEKKPKLEQVAGIVDGDLFDPRPLPRNDRDKVVLLKSQQRVAHGCPADLVTGGEILLAHLVSRRETTSEDIGPNRFVDTVAKERHGLDLSRMEDRDISWICCGTSVKDAKRRGAR